MASFSLAIPTVLRHEGGWCNTPGDKGGETNYGISLLAIVPREGWRPEDLGLANFNPGCMKFLSQQTAEGLWQRVWGRHLLDQLADQAVATKLFDHVANFTNTKIPVAVAQLAASCAGHITKPDGVMGPDSLRAMNACDPAAIVREMCRLMDQHYLDIVTEDPTQRKFYDDEWHARAQCSMFTPCPLCRSAGIA